MPQIESNGSAPPGATELMVTAIRPPTVMDRGEGSWLWDTDGRRYLDFVQGWAVNALGHAPRVVRDALAHQSERLLTPSPAFHNAPQLELAAELTRASGLDRVFFGSTGAEANEGALKLARKWGQVHRDGAYEIVTTEGAFHGRTLATMAASGKPGWDDLFPPKLEGFLRVPFGDLAAIEHAIKPKTAAVMLEPIQGEGGVVVPPAGHLAALRELTRERGVLLVLDEVQTGMGRTGTLFAHQQDGIRPDILALGKGLGAGFPVSALLASDAAACFEPGDQGGTFAGNPLACAVGLAVLRTIAEPAFLAHVQARAAQLDAGLRELSSRHGHGTPCGRGLLQALPLATTRATDIAQHCMQNGLLINAPRPDRLRFMPALNVTEAEIAAMFEILDRALAS